MTPNELTPFLHQRIPAAAYMKVNVEHVQNNLVELSAPLEPNTNFHGTLFGGSAAAVAMVAAWSLVYTRLIARGLDATQLVVQREQMTFIKPVRGAFVARAWVPEPSERAESGANILGWDAFIERLHARGKGSVTVHASIRERQSLGLGSDQPAALLDAWFAVALPSGGSR